ncbi:MAG: GNAT family N-acetyltransferase [Bacteroidota bacterium]|nr:GNAT family N-acetyltransferase [Bacteroidota bacterium]
MILLDPKDYYKLEQPLRSVGINHLFARAVIEQKMDGEVYVDKIERPSTFYVKHSYGMALLLGKMDKEPFNRQLVSYLLNENNNRKANEWLQAYPQQWNDKLEGLLDGRLLGGTDVEPNQITDNQQYIKVSTRVNFSFKREKYVPFKPEDNDEFKLVKTDAELFDQISGTVVPRYFWRNKKEFVQQGAGFSLMLEDEPVSTAFSAFAFETELELGIETQSLYQGKGLAQLVCSALIDFCLENNLEPVWACRLENTGSFQLAQKLGFEPVRMIPYYQLPI